MLFIIFGARNCETCLELNKFQTFQMNVLLCLSFWLFGVSILKVGFGSCGYELKMGLCGFMWDYIPICS